MQREMKSTEERRGKNEEWVPEICVSATAACLSPCIDPLAGPGIEAWDNDWRLPHRQKSTLSFWIGLARRIMSKPKIQGLPGRIHPQCRWMTWICGGAELGDETVWRWMRNEWWTIVVIYMLTSGWTGRGDMAVPSRHKEQLVLSVPTRSGIDVLRESSKQEFHALPSSSPQNLIRQHL